MRTSLLLFLLASIINLMNATTTYTTSTYTYKTVDNLDIEAIVYSPTTFSSGQLSPVFMAIHAGGFLLGAKDNKDSLSNEELDELCSRGWTVVSINYRLAPFVLLQDIVEDVQDAYDWIRNELSQVEPINPDFITVSGASAGGGLALIAGYKLSPRPKAIVAFYPYCSNYNDLAVSDPTTQPSEELLAMMSQVNQSISAYYYANTTSDSRLALWEKMTDEKKGGWAMVSRDPEESAESIIEKLKAFSAIDNIDEEYPPTYLAHGLRDGVVLFSQSIQMAEKLQENKIDFQLDLIYGAGHMYDRRSMDDKTWNNHVLPAFDFAAKYMK